MGEVDDGLTGNDGTMSTDGLAVDGLTGNGIVRESTSAVKTEPSQDEGFVCFMGELDGEPGLLIPYDSLMSALRIPAVLFMVDLIDGGVEVAIVLYNEGAVRMVDGVSGLVSPVRSLLFVSKKDFLDIIGYACKDFSAYFTMFISKGMTQFLGPDPILIHRHKNHLYIWIEECKRESMEFIEYG